MFSKKEIAIVSNLRCISKTNFILSWIEHEKSFITLRPDYTDGQLNEPIFLIVLDKVHFQQKNIIAHEIYSLKAPCQGASIEYPEHFHREIKKKLKKYANAPII